jgi:hypothetical protein
VKYNVEKHENPPKRRTQLWLIDYDLKDAPCRRQFYRQISKIMGEKGLAAMSSSKSVVATEDEKTARTVYALTTACGVSHLYRATPVDAHTNKA